MYSTEQSMIEARLSSVACHHGRNREAKGVAAEEQGLSWGFVSGPSENIRRTVTFLWSAIVTCRINMIL